jgi:hypothetical protein
MNGLLNCDEQNELYVHDARFSFMGGRYSGKGWLRWDPEEGARLDLVVNRKGPPLPKRIGFGHTGWLKPEHYARILLRPEGFDWIVLPSVGLVDRLDLVAKSSLSIHVSRLLCRTKWTPQAPRISGRIALGLAEETRLFEPVQQETIVGNRTVRRTRTAKNGIKAEIESVNVCGRIEGTQRARIAWSAHYSDIPRGEAWSFGYALRAAISLCTQSRTLVLERDLFRSGSWYRELQPFGNPSRLSMLAWFTPLAKINSADCVELALALGRNSGLLEMAWGVLSQLVDAEGQSSWGSRELLVAVILEGILRTLDGKPFVPGGRRYNPQGPMKQLRKLHFPSVTAAQADRALAAHRRLRNRNAHPDWLEPNRWLTRDVLEESASDMIFLSKLYGRIIFEVAGLPNIASVIELL